MTSRGVTVMKMRKAVAARSAVSKTRRPVSQAIALLFAAKSGRPVTILNQEAPQILGSESTLTQLPDWRTFSGDSWPMAAEPASRVKRCDRRLTIICVSAVLPLDGKYSW